MGVMDLTQDNKTREDILHELGVTQTTILEKLSKDHGIEEVRSAFTYIWISDDCVYIEQCCLNYTKTWNPLLEVWRNEPKRNQWAHGADAVRYLVQAYNVHLKEHTSVEWTPEVYGGVAV